MTAAMMIALAAGAAAWVLAPLFRARAAGPPLGQGSASHAGREAAQAALRDFELDYATGKISPEDYQILRPRYEAQANGASSRDPAPQGNSPGGGATGRCRECDVGLDAPPAAGGRTI